MASETVTPRDTMGNWRWRRATTRVELPTEAMPAGWRFLVTVALVGLLVHIVLGWAVLYQMARAVAG